MRKNDAKKQGSNEFGQSRRRKDGSEAAIQRELHQESNKGVVAGRMHCKFLAGEWLRRHYRYADVTEIKS